MTIDSQAALMVPTAAVFRSLCARVLERQPSQSVFDNRLNPPRSDFDLNPELRYQMAQVTPRPAAVLVPVVARPSGLTVLLTQRPDTMPSHPGQIAFPGGKMDPNDPSPVHTALRETEEEIGLAARHIEVLGFLDNYQTGTGFRVVPVVSLVDPEHTLNVDPREVADAFEVPLSFLLDPANHQRHSRQVGEITRYFYAMPYQGRFIWGATAGMLRNLYERLAR
jgi:8-oxo-dGTP pyrophosphatase MutT (NUDIX family)